MRPGAGPAHSGTNAGAHHGLLTSLQAGLLHPFTGTDHLLAMRAVGLWTALAACQRADWLVRASGLATAACGALLLAR